MCRTSRGLSGLNGQVVQRNTGTFALWDSACAARHCTATRQPTYAVRDAIRRQPELHRWITVQGRVAGLGPDAQEGRADTVRLMCTDISCGSSVADDQPQSEAAAVDLNGVRGKQPGEAIAVVCRLKCSRSSSCGQDPSNYFRNFPTTAHQLYRKAWPCKPSLPIWRRRSHQWR